MKYYFELLKKKKRKKPKTKAIAINCKTNAIKVTGKFQIEIPLRPGTNPEELSGPTSLDFCESNRFNIDLCS